MGILDFLNRNLKHIHNLLHQVLELSKVICHGDCRSITALSGDDDEIFACGVTSLSALLPASQGSLLQALVGEEGAKAQENAYVYAP